MFEAIVFDLDGTLAESKQPIESETAEMLGNLCDRFQVGIITGGHVKQITSQVVNHLPEKTKLSNLHLMPTSGASYWRWKWLPRVWAPVYNDEMTHDEANMICKALLDGAAKLGYLESDPDGDIVEFRGAQITFSGCGQAASLERKKAWDPDGSKRRQLLKYLASDLAEYDVRIGGSTSIDVTLAGRDKRLGMQRFLDQTGLYYDEVLFIGDQLDRDGNDHPVTITGVSCLSTTGPRHTVAIIKEYIERGL